MRAGNRAGWGLPDTVSAVPQVIQRPTIAGRLRPSVPENSTDSVATYRATTASGTKIGWTLGGTDASAFRASGDTLHFKQAPDFEKPIDAGKNNQYDLTLRAVSGAADTTVAVRVTVTDANEPGTVTLSSSQPKVGQHLTASLTDEDGLKKGTAATWTWQRLTSLSAAASPVLSTSYRYTVQAADLGRWLVARVSYTDRHGSASAGDTTTAAVAADVPRPPGSLTATAGNRQVALRWTAADDRGATITGYAYRDSTATRGKWSSWGNLAGSGASTTRATVTGLTNGRSYWFQVRAANSVGDGAASNRASATPKAPACTVTLTGPGSVSYAENGTGSVGTYTASASNCGSLTWSRGGTDASAFGLSGSGSSRSLQFHSAPNYETKSSYRVNVQAGAGTVWASRSVTVTVTNVDEAGTVSLSLSGPYVDDEVTATLTDPDGGITKPQWSWSSAGVDGQTYQTKSPKHTVPVAAFGKILKASVGYTDHHGSGKSASGTSAQTVRAHPPDAPPDFEATRGDGQASLSWGIAEGHGAPILGYDTRHRPSNGSWSDYTAATGRTRTIGSLTNGTLHYFQVRARNIGGAGASAGAQVTPAGRPGAPKNLTAAAGNAQATLTWEAAEENGSTIKHYEYRRRKGTLPWSSWATISGGSGIRSLVVTGLTNGSVYSFQVRAENGVDDGPAASRSVTPVKPDTPGSVGLSTTSPKVGKTVTATLSDADGGLKKVRWGWSYFGASGTEAQPVTEPVTASGLTSTLTPSKVLIGYRLRARANYDDAHGTGKQAYSAKTSAVKATTPGAPRSLSASGHYGQVTLTWQAPASNGGATVSGYRGRWKGKGAFTAWKSLGDGAARSYTVTNLAGGATYTFQVRAVNSVGNGAVASTSQVVPAGFGARAKPAGLRALPDTVLAALAAPNPFNAEITLHLLLPAEGPVFLTLYNTTGQRIRTLADGQRWDAGYRSLSWDGTDRQGRPVTSGVYLFRLQAGTQILVRKMVLIR